MSNWLSPVVERVDALRGLARQLRSGDLLRSALKTAQSDAVWVGPPREAFVNWLRALEGWVRNQLPAGIDAVAWALEQQVRAFEDAERAINAGMAPVLSPAPLGPLRQSPGTPPAFDPRSGPPRGKVRMDPDELDRLANLLGVTKDAASAFARRVRDGLEPLPSLCPPPGLTVTGQFLPPDAADAVGFPHAYTSTGRELDAAMLNLFDRARALRQADAPVEKIGAVLGAMSSTHLLLAEAARVAAAAGHSDGMGPAMPPAVAKAGAATAARLDHLVHAGDDDEVKRALDSLRRSPEYEPAYAAAVVNSLGADGLRDLCWKERFHGEKEQAYLCSLGELVADASRSGHLDRHVLDDLVALDEAVLTRLTRCGTWDPGHAYRIGMSIIERDPDVWDGLGAFGHRALDFLARHPDAAARFVAEHGDRLTGRMMLHLKDTPDWSSEVGRLLLATLQTTSAEELARSAATFEKVLKSIAVGDRHSKETRLAAAGFIATRMPTLVQLTGPDAPPPEYEGMTMKQGELQACMANLANDPDAWAVVAGGVSTELRRRSDAWAARIATELATEPDLMHATEKAAFGVQDDHWVGSMLGTMYQAVVDASDDAKEAAATLATILQFSASAAISLVPVVGAGGGLALKGLGELGRNVTGKGLERATKEASEVMTATSGQQPDPDDFRTFVLPKIRNVLAASLYNNETIRAKLTEVGMKPPPACCLQDGILNVPTPADRACYDQFRAWFEPPDTTMANPLFATADKFVHSDGGLMDKFESVVLHTTAGRTD